MTVTTSASSSLAPVQLRALGSAAIWLAALVAAALAASLRGMAPQTLAILLAVAAVPAVVQVLLSGWLRREWAQAAVIFAWLGLAAVGCIAFGLTPLALLFLLAPAAAALFEREKVVEAAMMAAVFLAVLFVARSQGWLPGSALGAGPFETELGPSVSRLAEGAGVLAATSFIAGALFWASARGETPTPTDDERLVRALPGAVIRTDATGKIVYVSGEALNVFGLEADGGVLPIDALVPGRPDVTREIGDIMERARQTGHRQSVRVAPRDPGDGSYALDLSAVPWPDGGSLLFAEDVTDYEGRLETMRRARASDPVADGDVDQSLFFAGVSHELRTPLNAIIGFSDMMRSRLFGPLPGRYAEYADLIHESGQHMLDLIGDVLDLSKVEAGRYSLQLDAFDAGDVIRSSVKMLIPTADAAEVQIRTSLPDTDIVVEADRKAVRQILLNLLSNAVKFSPRGARVDVEAAIMGEDLVISVDDQGPGMSELEIARIGQPYAQGSAGRGTSERGTGLGLALVRSLTDLHGGTFAVHSAPDEGLSASVRLPLSQS